MENLDAILILGGIIAILIGVFCYIVGVPYCILIYGMKTIDIAKKVYGCVCFVCILLGCLLSYIGYKLK